jgi:hypothetical protein
LERDGITPILPFSIKKKTPFEKEKKVLNPSSPPFFLKLHIQLVILSI